MPDILHRISIDAPREAVHDLVATTDGIARALRPAGQGGTTLLFTHAGWAEASEFMSGCSTNWGAYLTSLKADAEGAGFRAYPQGEVSRWA
jgi:hypothetical protein